MEVAHTITSIDKNIYSRNNQSYYCWKIIKINISKWIENHLDLYFYRRNILGGFIDYNHLIGQKEYDLIHGHGIWQLPAHQMASRAQRKNIPYVITPHGMIQQWSLDQKNFKKYTIVYNTYYWIGFYIKWILFFKKCWHEWSLCEQVYLSL